MYIILLHNRHGDTYKEHRKQVIHESKYLGGDMEHTHLVKGLDYALLEKVAWKHKKVYDIIMRKI